MTLPETGDLVKATSGPYQGDHWWVRAVDRYEGLDPAAGLYESELKVGRPSESDPAGAMVASESFTVVEDSLSGSVQRVSGRERAFAAGVEREATHRLFADEDGVHIEALLELAQDETESDELA